MLVLGIWTPRRGLAALACASAAFGFASGAQAQSINLNYDRLSSLEEPIAFDLGNVTVALNGLVDAPVAIDVDGDAGQDNVDPGIIGNFQVTAQTQLRNRWRVGAAYFGQYASEPYAGFDGKDDYSDNVAGFVGTSFGTVLGGNVSGQVREQTRRRRGVGNGFLAFDDFYGGLDDWGGAYVGRFGPMVLSGVVDESGNFEAGAVFQRPLGRKDYRFSARVRDGRFYVNGNTVRFDTKGAAAVGEFTYGASIFDLGVGYERLESSLTDADRWFVSGGARTKLGPLALSAEGHFGKAAGDTEKSGSLGLAYDVARGLSVNLGLNYEKAQIESGGLTLVSTNDTQAIGSVRFTF